MMPGPTYIYRCASCQKIFSCSSYVFGNNFGVKRRSDGKIDASILPCTPPLVACPHCDDQFCLIGAHPVDKFERYSFGVGAFLINGPTENHIDVQKDIDQTKKERYKDVPRFAPVSAEKCLKYIRAKKPTLEVEIALRLYAWHIANDLRMTGEHSKLDSVQADNLVILCSFFNSNDVDTILLRAEILRELEKFAEAAQALDRDFDGNEASIAEQLMQAIECKDRRPFVFAQEDRNADSKFSHAWIARRRKT